MNLVSEIQIGETTYIIEHSQNDAAQESVESKLTRIIFREIEHISNIQTKIINSIDLKSIQKHRQSNEYREDGLTMYNKKLRTAILRLF